VGLISEIFGMRLMILIPRSAFVLSACVPKTFRTTTSRTSLTVCQILFTFILAALKIIVESPTYPTLKLVNYIITKINLM